MQTRGMKMSKHQGIPLADTVVNRQRLMSTLELRELQDQHNVNLSAAGEGNEYFDREDDEYAGLTIMGEEEFFQVYCD